MMWHDQEKRRLSATDTNLEDEKGENFLFYIFFLKFKEMLYLCNPARLIRIGFWLKRTISNGQV